MTNDDIQKKMGFIVYQQAQFASDIGQLKDIVTRLANASLQRQDNLEEKFSLLVNAQIKTEENVAAVAEAQLRTDKRLAELAESHAVTDDRLNSLINVVERYISEGRNGKPRP